MRPDSFSLNPYEVLGVSANASTAEIQAAYRQHALRWHPDRNPNDEYSMRMMQRVNAAWAILKDEHSRAAYDRWERDETRSASGPQTWRRPHADSPPGGEWYRPPPPSVISCPRCNSTNEESSIYCYSCGYPFEEARSRQRSQSSSSAPGHNADTNPRSGLPAGFRQRLRAYVTDSIIALALAMAFTLTLMGQLGMHDVPVIGGPFGWLFLALPLLYFTVPVAAWSTTLGKLLFGLRVVRNDGSKIGIGRAFCRHLCYSISFLILGIGFLMVGLREDKRGLHDLICDTKVVYR